jgi:hypothetical protein
VAFDIEGKSPAVVSVFGRLLNMIDHQHIRRHPGRHKPQAELFLYGLTYSRSPETDTMPVMTPRPIGRTLEELTQTSPMMPPVQEFDSDLLAME